MDYVVPDGMPRSVFENKYSRRRPDGTFQTWAERVEDVVAGNFLLDPGRNAPEGSHANRMYLRDLKRTLRLAKQGAMPFSGRHLQHGDAGQADRLLELHTNCSTSMFSFMLFRLLLRGSGVGRDYSAATCRVDWDNMPDVRLVLDESHADFASERFRGFLEPLRDARHKYDSESERVRWFEVEDSREGWSHIVEILETAAFQEKHRDKLFVFDFSAVRPAGSPIKGLQGRPASGPLPLMDAIASVATVKGAGMPPWKQALFVDHYLASCVQMGGARRAARMAVKSWRDRDVIEFIDIKRGGHLWSANNSLLVDAEFWEEARKPRHSRARRIFEAAVNAAYFDKTGEPGFINVDRLNLNRDGEDAITGDTCIDRSVYTELHPRTRDMVDNVLSHVKRLSFPILTNPCGEIVLSTWGGYCVDGKTRILHRDGYSPIEDVVGKEVQVWNGEEWSAVTPFQTGTNQKLLRVSFSDGSYLDCTPYHRFSIRNGRQSPIWHEKMAGELHKGDILPSFRVPETISGLSESEAYTYGAFLGDGSIEFRSDKPGCVRYTIPLYAGKHHLPVSGTRGTEQRNTGIRVTVSHLDRFKLHSLKNPSLPEWVFGLDRASTMEFIKGWLDTDGIFHTGVGGVSISTVEEYRARGLHLLLRRIGISFATVRQAAAVGDMTNFGERTKPLWQVYVPASEAALLNGHRVKTDYELNLDHVVQQPRVVSVEELPGLHDTFCFTEPKRGMGVFGNVLTYQCVIADVNLSRCKTLEDAMDAVGLTAKFLVRCNRMRCEYSAETRRTNRIGVSLTGIHEFAWNIFGLTFRDMLLEKGAEFWMFIDRLREKAEHEAAEFSRICGSAVPHTVTTIKPSGTVSKVMDCTEGAHLPALAYYLRWVQYKKGDAALADLVSRGYPVEDVSARYPDHVVVGFPTRQRIADMMGASVVTADEATPAEQFLWVRLLEEHWLGGGTRNNQVSYTLKYDSSKVSYQEFTETILEWQPQVRCCSVMPQSDWRESKQVYGYVPEQPITPEEYADFMASIEPVEREDYDDSVLACEGGVCPIEPDMNFSA